MMVKAKQSAISWCGPTWNPWRGCEKLSKGCEKCYMFREQKRYGLDPTEIIRTTKFNEPLKWHDPELIFSCSWADFFHPAADPWRDEAWDIIRKTPHHYYLLLTKRSWLIRNELPLDWGDGWPHVGLGVTIEDASYMARLQHLIEIPAQMRWVSAEPLLGPLPNLHQWAGKFDWCIVGGESDYDPRFMDRDWAYDIIKQGQEHNFAVFMKQLGGTPNAKGDNPDEWPPPLKVQQFPPQIVRANYGS